MGYPAQKHENIENPEMELPTQCQIIIPILSPWVRLVPIVKAKPISSQHTIIDQDLGLYQPDLQAGTLRCPQKNRL